MIRFIKQKLLHKKWMVISLLIGNLLLVAIACSNPMYQNAALQKTLQSKLNRYIQEENVNPGILTFESNLNGSEGVESEYQAMQEMSQGAAERLGVEQQYLLTYHETAKTRGSFVEQRGKVNLSKTIQLASLSELDKHIYMIAGEMYKNQVDTSGYIEGIVSQRALSKLDLVIGDTLELTKFKDASGNSIRIKVVGAFSNSEEEDSYWVNTPSDYYMQIFVAPELFEKAIMSAGGDRGFEIKTDWHMVYDYKALQAYKVDGIVKETEKMMEQTAGSYSSFVLEPDYMTVFREYQLAAKKVTTTLLILQFPVLALLLAFIFMISRQMLELEQNEIALLKSRGSSKRQILFIYFLQSLILSGISCIIGLPLGYFLCKVLGSTNGFLEFIQRKALHITLNGSVFLYMFGAMAASICFMIIPVFRDADVTIVNVKHKKKNKKSLWQRVYLDVILLLISLYGLYSFTQRKDILMTQMLEGESLDPFLFICSSLFIISASLVVLRIQPLLIRIVYLIGRKHWRPSFFASFLQILRSRGKQSFMMVFLMLTVSLGIFNATVARTILSNSESNIRYEMGTDLVLKEVWEDNSMFLEDNPNLELTYSEPDFSVYENMEGVTHATKVYREDTISTSVDKSSSEQSQKTYFMAIDTKNFGETVSDFNPTLLPTHLNNYLNAMAKDASAVILSSNYHTKYGVELGDKITYENEDSQTIEGTVYGFVDYFPGYVRESHELSDTDTLVTTENFLVIANLAIVQQTFGIRPYEVWIHTDGSSQFIYDYAKQNNMEYIMFEDVASRLVDVKNDALFQGTNGILTMSFIVILILCCTGFLIYWILSIRQRELLFGVFRAMGMAKKEIIQMLINEQIFSSGISILIGAGLGILSSWLFVPLVQIFYASTDQAVPLQVEFEAIDMIRLFSVIGLVIIVCMAVLGKLINKINISQALKLGED